VYIVAIGWMYVVLMMTLNEATAPNGSVLGAFITLVLYGLLPLGIVLYIMGTPLRRQAQATPATADTNVDAKDMEQPQSPSITKPDASGHAPTRLPSERDSTSV
jgi:NADH:ubiquinone oxidoreductase subunit 6 (subunit J)